MLMRRVDFWKRIGFLALLYPAYHLIYFAMVFFIEYVFKSEGIIVIGASSVPFFDLLIMSFLLISGLVNKEYDKIYEIFGMDIEDLDEIRKNVGLIPKFIETSLDWYFVAQEIFYLFFHYIVIPGLIIYVFLLMFFRMWDIGLTGWHMFVGLIPIVGQLIFLYWLVQPSGKYAEDGKIITALNKLFRVRKRDMEPEYNDNPFRGRQKEDDE